MTLVTPIIVPDQLPVLRLRVTLRLLEAMELPAHKGALLRGGFGHAFQRSSCPEPCWGRADACQQPGLCHYRRTFETLHRPEVAALHDLRDVPRPFVIEPPADHRTAYRAGEALEFGLVLIGHGIDDLPHFLLGFEQLGRLGLGRGRRQARLERAEALPPWQLTGPVIYQDGRARDGDGPFPLVDAAAIGRRAAALPADLCLALLSPLRIKTGGDWLRRLDPVALVRAICWRLGALAAFHGDGPWEMDYRTLVEQAHGVAVARSAIRWQDWSRTSTRGEAPHTMNLGGLLGEATLLGVPPTLRQVLVAGSVVHVGKACVFGHGTYDLGAP